MPRSRLTPDEARRAALAAQGFGRAASAAQGFGQAASAAQGFGQAGTAAQGFGQAGTAAQGFGQAGTAAQGFEQAGTAAQGFRQATPPGPGDQPPPVDPGPGGVGGRLPRSAAAADPADAARPGPGTRAVAQVVRRLGAIQIDSVNVLTRAHYLPVFSRLGPYDRRVLDAASGRTPRSLFEYWGHEAALLPMATQPLLRWRMERAHREAWGGMRRVLNEHPGLVDEVAAAVRALGPVTITELEKELAHVAPDRREHWGWNWSNVKRAVEYLFWSGEISSAGRDSTFRRRYADVARVIPAAILRTPTPSVEDAQRELVRIAARAQGVATRADLADYFRLSQTETRRAVDELVESGDLVAVEVPGWPTAYAPSDLRVPRHVPGQALLAPFDPLIWYRARAERIFGMRYRIGIYTPAERREHGYYVLPFLYEGRLVARVDLKADRAAGRLLVQSAHGEPGCPDDALGALVEELQSMAEWLGLSGVVVVGAGELAPRLAALSRP